MYRVGGSMIRVLCIGKVKESFFKEAILEYQKRLSKYTKIEILEGPDYDLGNPELNKKQEKVFLLKHIRDKDYVITLEIEGKEFSSLEFSQKLEGIQSNFPDVTFVIGGSDGLDDEVKKRSNLRLSFSPMTFPHQLFRILLLEQIYRAYKIKNHESYHK